MTMDRDATGFGSQARTVERFGKTVGLLLSVPFLSILKLHQCPASRQSELPRVPHTIMADQGPTQVHFVGSRSATPLCWGVTEESAGVPLASSKEVFTTLCKSLPPGSLKRIPDGETGPRDYFVHFQANIFKAAGVAHVLMNTLDPTSF